jgi:2-iminoacetate synthase ThiH
MITSYRNHIKAVYEMEMFYGDETLQHLMDHTRSLHEVLDEFEDIYEIAVPPQEGEETDNNQEETQKDAPKTIDKENVFYAGSRTSNN